MGWGRQLLLCVYSRLLCFIDSRAFFLSFCLILLSLLKIHFLDSLKVKIIFFHVVQYHAALVVGAYRLHLMPEKFSRWLKTIRIGREKGTGIPKCFLCMRSGPFTTIVLFYDSFFIL